MNSHVSTSSDKGTLAAVVGAGFSGLATALQIQALDPSIRVVVLEARDRVGGRSLTWEGELLSSGDSTKNVDLGAAWIWPAQNMLLSGLASRFDVPLSPEGDGSFRLEGGTQALASKMAESVENIVFNREVYSLSRQNHSERIEIASRDTKSGNDEVLLADVVFLACPPRLIVQNISFQPQLESDLAEAMCRTRTWMAQQGKFVALYSSSFWRRGGIVQPNFYWKRCRENGPLDMLFENGSAIWAFLSNDRKWRSISPEQRRTEALNQLKKELGSEKAEMPLSTFEQDWSREKWTCSLVDADESNPWLHPNYSPVAATLRRPRWDGTLWFVGSETASPNTAGFLEGAVSAAVARTQQWVDGRQ